MTDIDEYAEQDIDMEEDDEYDDWNEGPDDEEVNDSEGWNRHDD